MKKASPKERAHQDKGHSKTHILQSFLGKEGDKKGIWEELTWMEAFKRSGIPRTTFRRLFVELVGDGFIKGEVRVEKGKLVSRFFLPVPSKPELDFRGVYETKEFDPKEVTVGYCVEKNGDVKYSRLGRMRKLNKGAKGENKLKFVPGGPLVKINLSEPRPSFRTKRTSQKSAFCRNAQRP